MLHSTRVMFKAHPLARKRPKIICLQSLPPRPFPKPPVRLFKDVKIGGSLHLVLTRFHQLMTARQLKRVDFTNPYHRKQVRHKAKFLC